MRKDCLRTCFPCGETQELTPTFVKLAPRRKCLSIVATSKTHPHIPSHHQLIPTTERNLMKKSHLHLIPKTSAPLNLSHVRPNIQAMNPEITLSSRKQQKVQNTQPSIDFQHQKTKSNVTYSILSERLIQLPLFQLNEEKYKQTSLYGGAKGIIERLSTKVPQPYDCSFNSDSYLQSNQHSKLTQQFTPTPRDKNMPFSTSYLDVKLQPTANPFKNIVLLNKFEQFRKRWQMDRQLGKGKYSHINLCYDKTTRSIYTLKDIFKQNTVPPQIYKKIYQQIIALQKISHPNIVSVFLHSNSEYKISLLQEYTISTLADEMELHKTLPLDLVKMYLSDLIQAIATLHDGGWIHGNINLSQIGVNFGSCKLRCSLTHQVSRISQSKYIEDIHSLAIIGFQMAFGLSSSDNLNKIQIKEQLQSQILRKDKSQDLCSLLVMLLSIEENIRLSASLCFNHRFFETK